jgi:Domain of unknown function (DUF4347)
MAEATHPSQPTAIALFDDSLEDVATLMRGVLPGVEVLLLQNGISDLLMNLAQRPHIRQIHLFCHAQPGELYLQHQVLSRTTLAAYTTHPDWRRAWLGRDLLLYGCQVGSGAKGKAFVQMLSRAMGARIVASETVTGNPQRGGDWQLTLNPYRVDWQPVLNSAVMANYPGILPTFTVTSTADSGAGSLRAAIAAAQSGDTIVFNSGLANQTITLASQLDISCGGADN